MRTFDINSIISNICDSLSSHNSLPDKIIVDRTIFGTILGFLPEEKLRNFAALLVQKAAPHWSDLGFANWAKATRLALGVTQGVIACEAGIHQPDLSRFEAGKKCLGEERADRLIAALTRVSLRAVSVGQ